MLKKEASEKPDDKRERHQNLKKNVKEKNKTENP